MRAALGGAVSCVARRMADRLNRLGFAASGIGFACFAIFLLKPDPLWACGPPLACGQCGVSVCQGADYDCAPKPSGTACTNGLCDGVGNCIHPPTTPGAITGPSSSITGSYMLCAPVDGRLNSLEIT